MRCSRAAERTVLRESHAWYKYRNRNEKNLEVDNAFLEYLGYELSMDEQDMLPGTMLEDLNASAPPIPENDMSEK